MEKTIGFGRTSAWHWRSLIWAYMKRAPIEEQVIAKLEYQWGIPKKGRAQERAENRLKSCIKFLEHLELVKSWKILLREQVPYKIRFALNKKMLLNAQHVVFRLSDFWGQL